MEGIRTRKGMRLAGLALAIAVLIALGIKWMQPHERQLMTVSRPILQMEIGRQQLAWLSNSRCLFTTNPRPVAPNPHRKGPPNPKLLYGAIDLLDLHARTRIRQDALMTLLNETHAFPMNAHGKIEVSPDGVWFLWENYNESGAMPCHAAHLDGTHYGTWGRSLLEDHLFLDAQHLVQMTKQNPPMLVLDLLDPAKNKTYPNPAQAQVVLTQLAVQQPAFVRVPAYSYAYRTDVPVEIDTYRTQDRLQRLLTTREPSQGVLPGSDPDPNAPKPLQTASLKMPEGARVLSAVVSPSQKSICYQLEMARTSPPQSWLHRIFSKFTPKPTFTNSLWVSRTDGRGLRELGQVPIQRDASGNTDDYLEDLQWLPDSKEVSFVYHGTLYVAPAEP